MRLHLLGLPHTVTDAAFSHCAFTQKVRTFAPMMAAQGYEVIHYGNGREGPAGAEHVQILGTGEHLRLLGRSSYHDEPSRFVGDAVTQELVDWFGARLAPMLEARVEPGDAVCLTFGHPHDAATRDLSLVRSREAARVETGIGYQDPITLCRVYESEAWRHWVMGREARAGAGWESPRREWVIPNHYDLEDWRPRVERDPGNRRVVFFGRITDSKGCAIVPRLARAHPELDFVLCGQGDPAPYLTEPNVAYEPPISGRDRAAFLRTAAVAVFPTRFLEPFCGGAVEAMLCGTPVLTSDFGAFTETVIEGVTGYRCSTERQWVEGIERAAALDRGAVAFSAASRYNLVAAGAKYRRVFDDVAEQLEARRPLAVA